MIKKLFATILLMCGMAFADGPFYVATNGSDSNPGTLAQPFATLTAAQTAMRSAVTKTTFIRAGTYQPASQASSSCINQSGTTTSAVELTSADNGETWSYYAADGLNSAIIDGQSTVGSSGLAAGANGIQCAFAGKQISNITITGLVFKRFQFTAWGVLTGTSLTASQNIVFNMSSAAFGTGAVVGWNCVATGLVDHNYAHDNAYNGIAIYTSSCGGSPGSVTVQNNFVLNSCTWPAVHGFGNDQNGGDCGGIYAATNSPSTLTVTNNYVRDVNVSSQGAGDNGSNGNFGCCAVGIYMDEPSTGVTVSGNISAGIMSAAFSENDGNNMTFSGNIADLDNTPYASNFLYIGGHHNNAMTGNSFTNSIIIADSIGAGHGYFGSQINSGTQSPMTIQNNAYFNYVGSTITTIATNGGGTSGGGAGSDSNPTFENPQLSTWKYMIAGGSPVFNSPVSFPGITGGWGPTGFVIPQLGTLPSFFTSAPGTGTTLGNGVILSNGVISQ